MVVGVRDQQRTTDGSSKHITNTLSEGKQTEHGHRIALFSRNSCTHAHSHGEISVGEKAIDYSEDDQCSERLCQSPKSQRDNRRHQHCGKKKSIEREATVGKVAIGELAKDRGHIHECNQCGSHPRA